MEIDVDGMPAPQVFAELSLAPPGGKDAEARQRQQRYSRLRNRSRCLDRSVPAAADADFVVVGRDVPWAC